MTVNARAQLDADSRLLDDTQVAYAEAIGALDKAKGMTELLHDAHLLDDSEFWEAISAFDSMTTLLEEFRESFSR